MFIAVCKTGAWRRYLVSDWSIRFSYHDVISCAKMAAPVDEEMDSSDTIILDKNEYVQPRVHRCNWLLEHPKVTRYCASNLCLICTVIAEWKSTVRAHHRVPWFSAEPRHHITGGPVSNVLQFWDWLVLIFSFGLFSVRGDEIMEFGKWWTDIRHIGSLHQFMWRYEIILKWLLVCDKKWNKIFN